MTEDEIIIETVQFYGADLNRRAARPGDLGVDGCAYFEPGDPPKCCAFGRCMTRPSAWANCRYGVRATLEDHKVRSADEVLQEKYHGHRLEFWESLQKLHDRQTFWNADLPFPRLTDQGRCHVIAMLRHTDINTIRPVEEAQTTKQ